VGRLHDTQHPIERRASRSPLPPTGGRHEPAGARDAKPREL